MITLYEHQRVALAHLRVNEAFALFMEQGTGKTLPTLLRCLELAKAGKAQTILVVTIKAVMGAWWRTVEMMTPEDQALLQRCMTVTSFGLVWRREAFRRHWGVIVIDESHKIKHHTTRQGKALLRMALDADYRYILTGTPISNGQLENIWSQFAFLEPYAAPRGQVYSRIFGGSYYDFVRRYAFLDRYHKPYRYRHVDELQGIIGEYSYRVTKAECLDLPEKLPDEIYEMKLLEKKLYRQLHKESASEEYGIIATNPLSRMVRLRQVCSGYIHTGSADLPLKCEKLAALDELLDSLEGGGWPPTGARNLPEANEARSHDSAEGCGVADKGKKLVIFCEFRHSIAAVAGLLRKRGIGHVVLDGEQKDKAIWQKFQTEAGIQVILCQYQSANAGVDLYAADTILYYEPTLSSNILEQSRDRIHRIGQGQKCSYLHFLTTGTIETAIYKALKGYGDFNEKLFTEYMAEFDKGVRY